jgi:hypothetical protein
MKDEHFVQILEAKEWAKHADEFDKETVIVRELRIQAKKFERLLAKSLREFISAKGKPPSKKRRKKEGRANQAIDRQYKKVLMLADKAMREEYRVENGLPMKRAQAQKLTAETQELVRQIAAKRFEILVLKQPAVRVASLAAKKKTKKKKKK